MHIINKLEIPESVTELSIGKGTFTDCDSFEIIIPNSVTNLAIPWGALLEYTSSKKVEISKSVIRLTLSMENWATQKLLYDRYKRIIKIKVPEHIKDLTIAEETFRQSNLISFEVSPGVQKVVIGKRAFSLCNLLSEVVINASNLELDSCPILFCSALKKVIRPPNVNEIGLRWLKSKDIINEGYVSRIKHWVGSAISSVWDFIKFITNRLVFWL